MPDFFFLFQAQAEDEVSSLRGRIPSHAAEYRQREGIGQPDLLARLQGDLGDFEAPCPALPFFRAVVEAGLPRHGAHFGSPIDSPEAERRREGQIGGVSALPF